MKVAFVNMPWSAPFLPVPRGDSIALWTQAVTQRLSSICNVIIYGNSAGTLRRVENYGRIQFRRVPNWLDWLLIKPIVTKLLGRSSLISQWYFGFYIWQIALDLRRQNCDIVHIYTFPQFVSVIRRLNPQIKIVMHSHEEWLVQFDRHQIEQYLQHADLILGCSNYLVNKIQQQFPHYAARCRTVFNGVDIVDFDHLVPINDLLAEQNYNDVGEGDRHEKYPKSSMLQATNPLAYQSTYQPTKQLTFVGRISPEKGLHVLLEAFERVVEVYPNVELNLIGPYYPLPRDYLLALSDDPKVMALVQYCGMNYQAYLQSMLPVHVAQKVHWVGHLEHPEVIEHLCQTDIVINPSFSESFGNSIVEAMSVAVPVIAGRVGGMMDTVVEGKTGLFFESGNVAELTEAILSLLTDEQQCQAMGQAGRKRVADHFTWDRVVEQLLMHYQTIHEHELSDSAKKSHLCPKFAV